MSKITESARGEECQVRIPGYCLPGNETVVLAHLPGGGVAAKMPDYQGAYCCQKCHDILDYRLKTSYSVIELKVMQYEAVFRTQEILKGKGLINIIGEKNGKRKNRGMS